MIEYVTKRDGEVVEFDAEKLNAMAKWATQAAPTVQWSDIVMDAMRSIQNTVVAAGDIQKALIKTCLEKRTPKHNKVAGRLLLGDIRRSSLANQTSFVEFYYQMVEDGYWREMDYNTTELEELESYIDYDRDLTYGYPTLRQFDDKYALHDENGFLLEIPQYMYMGVAMSMFEYGNLNDVVMYYDKISLQKVNPPSPVLTGQRAPSNVGVSCVVPRCGDSVDSIEALKHIAAVATAHSAGLGMEYGVRSEGDSVRKGYATAGGQLPHLRVMEKIVNEFKQSNRGGAATISFNCLDPELETLLNLKLKRTPETKRIDQLDYTLVWNNVFLKYAAKKKLWPLVSRAEMPALWEAHYDNDMVLFETLIEEALTRAEGDQSRIRVVKALDILIQYVENRQETGRLFRFNTTEIMNHTPFNENIYHSNLCLEIALPNKSYGGIMELYKTVYEDGDGITAQCFLSAMIAANIVDDKDYEECTYIATKALDNLIERMDYPFPQFKATAHAYRSIGIGLSGVAEKIARDGKSYSDVEYLHEMAERHYYYLLKASIRLSQERGEFEFINKTKWKEGWTPEATYNRNVDKIVQPPLNSKYNLESLSEDVLKYGVRFSTLCAHMPCESSSVLTNTTNGLYPIRQDLQYKKSKKGLIQFFAPDCDDLNYESAWDIDPYVMLDAYAIFTKFCDQTISADDWEDLSKYPDGKMPMTTQLKKIFYGNKHGIKTAYYANTRTGRGEGGVEDDLISEESSCINCDI